MYTAGWLSEAELRVLQASPIAAVALIGPRGSAAPPPICGSGGRTRSAIAAGLGTSLWFAVLPHGGKSQR